MAKAITSIGLFCSSSRELAPEIYEAGRNIGAALAQAGYVMVYGGTTCGLMGVTSEAHKKAGGRLVGVVPKFMDEQGLTSPLLDEKVLVSNMASRKEAMNKRSDALVILPGGIGTYDEFFDILAQKQLELHSKPIILLNIRNYYEPLKAVFQCGVDHKTISPDNLSLFHIAPDVSAVVELLKRS